MLPFKVDLSGKVAVVTGGSGVLCGEMARSLGACGAKVVVMARTQSKVEAVVAEIKEAGGEAMAVSCDVMDRDSVLAACEAVEANYGPCDILINGAGGNHPKGTAALEQLDPEAVANGMEGSFFDMEASGISFVFDLNLIGTITTSQIFGKKMAERGTGNIINISSMSAYHPLTKVMAYSAAKAAVNSFTEWLATHLAPSGVRVNGIAPGFFLTTQNYQLLMGDNDTPTPRCAKILASTPMNRLGKKEELTGALLYLASDAASGFVTGITLAVDGGFNAYSGV